ncbi:porin family protein [Aestuariivivens sediminis]|uniref:porin family protein n=1 Tax=Aestuariivivens sediminis TaxID=2913557 RepID=UPI001F575D60|nr:porin family protein [Aestuariivivens sediminis]
MKKILFFTVLTVLGLFNLPAQEVNFGLKGGVDFASLRLEAEGENISTSETGFYIGALVEIQLSDNFALQPELLYVVIDFEDMNFDYISIPIVVKYSVSNELDLIVGPNLGFILDTEEGEKSFNFGLEGGASYDITENFFIEARYNLGLANLLEDAPSGYAIKLNGFFAGIGYKF